MESIKKKTIIFISILIVIVLAIIIGYKKCNDVKQSLIGKTYSGIASTYEDYKMVEGDTFYLVIEFLDKRTCNISYVHYENEGHKSYKHGKDEYKGVAYSLSFGFGGLKLKLQRPAPQTNEVFKISEENGQIIITTDDFKNGLPLTMQEGLAWE